MSRLKLSWNSGFSSKIGSILPNSGRAYAWKLYKGFFFWGGGGIRGHVSLEEIRNLKSSNCWKCIEIVCSIIFMLFLYHFKYFTIPSGGPFWLLVGCVRTGLCTYIYDISVQFNSIEINWIRHLEEVAMHEETGNTITDCTNAVRLNLHLSPTSM